MCLRPHLKETIPSSSITWSEWENKTVAKEVYWSMEDLIDALQKWLRRNNTETCTQQHKKSEKVVKKLKLKPARHKSQEILTVNGSKVQSMPIFDTSIVSLDGKACEEIELTGSRLADFTTVRRPDMNQLKLKYSHTQDKRFYMTSEGEYQIHLILGDSMYSRIRTEKVFKGNPGEPLVEETTFGWVVHGGVYK